MKLTAHMNHLMEDAIYESMDECGSCGGYHPADWIGDCRDDDYRYHPDDMSLILKAAPDLLEACETALNERIRLFKDPADDYLCNQLQLAIKKAKGG